MEKKIKREIINQKEDLLGLPDAQGEFWTWCEKCLERIIEESDSYRFKMSQSHKKGYWHYEFDICNDCYISTFNFLEECFTCNVCKIDITDRDKMHKDSMDLYCSLKCYQSTWPKVNIGEIAERLMKKEQNG